MELGWYSTPPDPWSLQIVAWGNERRKHSRIVSSHFSWVNHELPALLVVHTQLRGRSLCIPPQTPAAPRQEGRQQSRATKGTFPPNLWTPGHSWHGTGGRSSRTGGLEGPRWLRSGVWEACTTSANEGEQYCNQEGSLNFNLMFCLSLFWEQASVGGSIKNPCLTFLLMSSMERLGLTCVLKHEVCEILGEETVSEADFLLNSQKVKCIRNYDLELVSSTMQQHVLKITRQQLQAFPSLLSIRISVGRNGQPLNGQVPLVYTGLCTFPRGTFF